MDIEKEAAISAHSHFVSGRRWEKTHLMLGIPSTILAAVAGVSAFSEQSAFITGGIAMLAAALAAVNTFLSPGDRASSHRQANVTFSQIRREASLLRDVDAQLIDDTDEEAAKELAQRLRDLTAKITETDQSAPTISSSAKHAAETLLA